jgi:hypothetical protein
VFQNQIQLNAAKRNIEIKRGAAANQEVSILHQNETTAIEASTTTTTTSSAKGSSNLCATQITTNSTTRRTNNKNNVCKLFHFMTDE